MHFPLHRAAQAGDLVAVNAILAALVQEKPFNNVNGSGKHNNWSIGTTCGGVNLLNVKQLAEKSVLLHVTVVV